MDFRIRTDWSTVNFILLNRTKTPKQILKINLNIKMLG